MSSLNDDLKGLANTSFDGTLAMRGGYSTLAKLLDASTPDFVHVQCTMFQYQLGRFVIENCGRRCPVICEFYDITSIYAPRPAPHRKWRREQADAVLYHERFICRSAPAIVHRFPATAAANDELRARHAELTHTLSRCGRSTTKHSDSNDRMAERKREPIRSLW